MFLQARAVSTDGLKPSFYTINVVVYAVQVKIVVYVLLFFYLFEIMDVAHSSIHIWLVYVENTIDVSITTIKLLDNMIWWSLACLVICSVQHDKKSLKPL